MLASDANVRFVIQAATGTVTLSWTAPLENEDGTALTDLSAYTIYYGQESGDYDRTVSIDNPGMTTYVVENLTAGTWYFVASISQSRCSSASFCGCSLARSRD